MEWIAVKDKLPENQEIILTYTYTGIDILQYLDDTFYHYDNGYIQEDVITHWMPLPKEPKDE